MNSVSYRQYKRREKMKERNWKPDRLKQARKLRRESSPLPENLARELADKEKQNVEYRKKIKAAREAIQSGSATPQQKKKFTSTWHERVKTARRKRKHAELLSEDEKKLLEGYDTTCQKRNQKIRERMAAVKAGRATGEQQRKYNQSTRVKTKKAQQKPVTERTEEEQRLVQLQEKHRADQNRKLQLAKTAMLGGYATKKQKRCVRNNKKKSQKRQTARQARRDGNPITEKQQQLLAHIDKNSKQYNDKIFQAVAAVKAGKATEEQKKFYKSHVKNQERRNKNLSDRSEKEKKILSSIGEGNTNLDAGQISVLKKRIVILQKRRNRYLKKYKNTKNYALNKSLYDELSKKEEQAIIAFPAFTAATA